ncbi:MAG: AbrB/MazE/SpoVT family DNA-binding domain-containing protein [Pyrinomonadaceae bacterium]
MTTTLKLTTIGNSTGVILPREILEKLRVSKGDTIFVTETKEGIELKSYDPVVARQMEIAERVMRKHRNVLRKLAE